MTEYSVLITKLLQLPQIGRKRALKLVREYDDQLLNSNFIQSVNEITKADNRLPKFSEAQLRYADKRGTEIVEASYSTGIKITTILDADYPIQLLQLRNDPPISLHYKGNLEIVSNMKSCAVIGTREPTDFGRRIGERIGERLAENKVTVISGLAKGCDTAGHLGCLKKEGKTAAILAHGLKHKIYPKENRMLGEEILDKGGVLITEYSLFETPKQNYFIERDRIQAGLSDAIFVVETGVKGGTMHTVNFGLACNRKVFAFDHPDSMKHEEKAQGNQMLIKDNIAVPIRDEESMNRRFLSVFQTLRDTRFFDAWADAKLKSDDGNQVASHDRSSGSSPDSEKKSDDSSDQSRGSEGENQTQMNLWE